MNYIYLIALFIFTVALSAVFTLIIKKTALKLRVFDTPKKLRKIHKTSMPLLGGVAIFLSFFIIIYFIRDKILAGNLEASHWIGVFIGACFIMIGGFLDDKYDIKPKYQIIWPVLACLSVIIGGVEIEKILGGSLYLNTVKIPIIKIGINIYYFVLFSDILIIIWLLGMMFTTKLLDGIDGLVTGVTAIGAFIIFLFTITSQYYQPDIGIAALTLSAACAGFLIFNWHPAKIFLGEGGSLLLGFILGVLAIISGGKIAIALLIMGIPIMDVAWVIIRRLREGKNPFRFADRKHLHFRILDLGIGQRKTVLVYYGFAAIFGLSALTLQSLGKVFALGFLVLVMLAIIAIFNYLDNKKRT